MSTLKVTYGTEEEVNLGSVAALVAFATGGQATGTPLTKKWNEIATCATDFDSALLLAAKIGSKQVVYNAGVATLSVYPQIGEKINGVTNMQFNVGAGQVMTFESHKNGLWFSYGGTI